MPPILAANLVRSPSLRSSVSFILFISRLTGGSARCLRSFGSILERWWILVRGWSDDHWGGQGCDCEFFIRSPSLRLSSPRFSSVAHKFCVQHRRQEKQQDDADADADDEPSVPAVGSISVLKRGLVALS